MKNILKKLLLGCIFSIAFIASGLCSKQVEAGVGDSIADTFPDANMAQLVADKIGGGDTNHIITQANIDNSIIWDDFGFEFINDISGVEYFVNLESFQVPFNNITFLPENFGNLTKLKYLDLSGNLLTELPSNFGNLSSLVNLWISENQLTGLPDSFTNLGNLERLEADFNKLATLPNDLGNLSNLTVLFLTYNELTELPNSVGGLQNLQVLRLGNNYLTSLPDTLGNMSKLKTLWLNENKLKELPQTIVQLTTLENLAIGNNSIVYLPEDFEKMESLIVFSFENNQMTSLPINFKSLPSLQTLRLYGNLLPTDIAVQLSDFTINSVNLSQDKLKLTSNNLSYIIKNQTDYDQIDYISYLALTSNRELSLLHTYVFDEAEDENGEPVALDDYIKNGKLVKSGKVYVKVRAVGLGLFPNTSDNGITDEVITLNFEATFYKLSFDLNGATGVVPITQNLLEGEVGTGVADPTRSGYTFKGWNTLQNGSGINWVPGTTPMPGNDVILYAQWEENSKPIPPVPPTPESDKNGNSTIPSDGLPKTGGYESLLFSLLTLGTGVIVSIKGFKKK